MTNIQKLPTNTEGKDYIVGDLHGCYTLLDRLLSEIKFDLSKDRLFSVGDLADRGPDSLRCLQLLDEPWFYTVQGNHEEMLLECFLPYLESGKLTSLDEINASDCVKNGGDWVKQFYLPEQERTFNILSGGAGNDTYNISNASDQITELATAGEIDTVNFSGTTGTFTMGANVEKLNLLGTDAISAIGNASDNTMTGNVAGNTLSGLDGNDTINGGSGDDILVGGNGNDALNGLTGNDNLIGGAGDDTYTVDSVADTVDETIGSGIDLVNRSVSYVLNNFAASVENLMLTGSAVTNATGNALANTLIGNGVANTLIGLAGNDTISAGVGIDTITFGAGVTDTVAAASSIAGVDLFSDLAINAGAGDIINLTVTVANANTAVTGSVSTASFITNMNTLLAVGGGIGSRWRGRI
jgi:Ca2+-binding RTX toxin-like protein